MSHDPTSNQREPRDRKPYEFDRPLGLDRPALVSRRPGVRLTSGNVAGVGTSLLVMTVVGYAALYGSPDGGRARGVGTITDGAQTARIDSKISRDDATGSIPPRAQGSASGTAPGGVSTATDIEAATGVRVTRGAGGVAPGALIIRLDEAAGRLPPAPDPRLVERTKLGALPKIGADGSRPSQVYARPWRADPAKASAPKIALMVGGLGLSAATTRDAIEKLPSAVTFAFAPYGVSLEADTAQARERGHETVLQLPMEPIDSARNDPGPHTLQLAASASETDADLQWLLTRFTGYFAVSPFLGGRFLQSADALSPVLRDISARGLTLVEDGSPARSALADSARNVGLGAIRATVRLDADSDAKGFDGALAKLEAAARKDGFALGTASALPATIEKLAKFIAGLETRGFVLVPVSAGVASLGPLAQEADPRR